MGRTYAVARHPALGHNTRRAIYKLICAYGPLSCRDVADMMGCKSTDIIGHVTALHRARLVCDAGPSPTGRRYQERKDGAQTKNGQVRDAPPATPPNEAALRLFNAWHGRA